MPLYDFECNGCGKVFRDILIPRESVDTCDECGANVVKMVAAGIPHIFPSDGIFLRNVSSEGKRFYSKQEMKDYAKKHDLQLGALE